MYRNTRTLLGFSIEDLPVLDARTSTDARMSVPDLTLAILLMDASSSMQKFGSAPETAMKNAVHQLQVGPDPERVAAGIIVFSDNGHVLVPIQPVQHIRVEDLSYHAPHGNTRLYGTIEEVLYLLYRIEQQRSHIVTRVALQAYTDGQDNRSPHRLNACRELARYGISRGWSLGITGYGVDGRVLAHRMNFSDGETVQADQGSICASTTTFVKRTHGTMMGYAVPDGFAPSSR